MLMFCALKDVLLGAQFFDFPPQCASRPLLRAGRYLFRVLLLLTPNYEYSISLTSMHREQASRKVYCFLPTIEEQLRYAYSRLQG